MRHIGPSVTLRSAAECSKGASYRPAAISYHRAGKSAEGPAAVPSSTRSKMPASLAASDPFLNDAIVGSVAGTTMKGSVGLSSALSRPVLLRIKVTASEDVHFTTTISVWVFDHAAPTVRCWAADKLTHCSPQTCILQI